MPDDPRTADPHAAAIADRYAARAVAATGCDPDAWGPDYSVLNPRSGPFWHRMGYRPLWTGWKASPASAVR